MKNVAAHAHKIAEACQLEDIKMSIQKLFKWKKKKTEREYTYIEVFIHRTL